MSQADGIERAATATRPPAPREGELARYAGAIWTLVRTDFKARYHGTLMGFVWALLKPLAMVATLMAVFQFVFSQTPNYAAHLLIGIFLYDYFQEGTKTGLVALHSKGYLLTKSRFPRWILVVTSTANALITFSVASGGVILFLCATGRAPDPARALLFAAYVLQLALVVIGVSLGASVLFVRYRDMNQVWEVVTQAGFFAAPVVYPLEAIPVPLHKYLFLWPPTSFIQFSRAVLLGQPLPTLKAHALMVGLTGGVLALGVLVYRRFSGRVAEHL